MYGKNDKKYGKKMNGVDLGKKEELKNLMKQDKENIAYDIHHVKEKTDKAKKKYGY
jgi:hypothetical protein